MSKLLTTKQVQQLLKIDRVTVYRMLNDGRLKGIKVGNQWRFQEGEIDRILGKQNPTEEEEPIEALTDFPVDCAEKILEIFAGMIGVGALTVTLKGEPLTNVIFANPFCKRMMENPNSRQACQASWRKIALRATGKPPYMVCHAGLSYIRSVIQMNNQDVALLVTGQFYLSPPNPENEDKRLEDLANRYGIPLVQLKNAAAKIPVLKRSQQKVLQDWAPKVALTVQSMLCERSELILRLQRIASLSKIQKTLPYPQNQ